MTSVGVVVWLVFMSVVRKKKIWQRLNIKMSSAVVEHHVYVKCIFLSLKKSPATLVCLSVVQSSAPVFCLTHCQLRLAHASWICILGIASLTVGFVSWELHVVQLDLRHGTCITYDGTCIMEFAG